MAEPMPDTLRDRLGDGPLTTRNRDELRALLAHPVCWPRMGPMVSVAMEVAGAAPAGPEVGETYFAGTWHTGGKAQLWRIVLPEHRRPSPAAFGQSGGSVQKMWMAAEELADQIIERGVAQTASLDPRSGYRGRIGRVAGFDGRFMLSVLSSTMGVAALLSRVGVLRGVRAPASVLCILGLDWDGRLVPSDGLFGATGELALARGFALAVETLVVDASQEDAVREWCAQHDWPVEVRGAATPVEVVELVYGRD